MASVPSLGKKSSAEDRAKRNPGIEELALEKIRDNPDLQLGKLVEELTSELGYKRDRVLKKLVELNQSGKLGMVESSPYKTLASFSVSPLSLWFWGALLATLASLGLVSATAGAALYLRYVFGGLLILYLPGYSLIQYLYAKKKELDGITHLALSIGLSIAIVPLIGFALNFTPFGIKLIPVVLSLSAFTIIFLFLALRKRHSYYKLSKGIF